MFGEKGVSGFSAWFRGGCFDSPDVTLPVLPLPVLPSCSLRWSVGLLTPLKEGELGGRILGPPRERLQG